MIPTMFLLLSACTAPHAETTGTHTSPRFVPLYWRVATSDAVVIGSYLLEKAGADTADESDTVNDSAHALAHIAVERVLRGPYDAARPFRFLADPTRAFETESLGIDPGERAVFLLREGHSKDGLEYYTVSQGAGTRGACRIQNPMPTFPTGLYEYSLEDQRQLPWFEFEELLISISEEVTRFEALVHRYENRRTGDSEVGVYELYPALARVRDEDVDEALTFVRKALDEEERNWVRQRIRDPLARLERRAGER